MPVDDLAGAQNSEHHFYFDVEDAGTITIAIAGTSGDADLYIRKGAQPTTSSWDHRPYLNGSNEEVVLSGAAAGRYYVMVRGYTAYSGVTLTATATAKDGGGGFGTITGLAAKLGQELTYFVDVPTGAKNLAIDIADGVGDADLYVRYGAPPTVGSWDYRPYLYGNSESVLVGKPQAGRWHVMIRAYRPFDGVTLSVSHE